VELGKPKLVNSGYQFPVTVGTTTYLNKAVMDASPAKGIKELIRSATLSEKLAALVVGTKIASATFKDAIGTKCAATVDAYVKVVEPTIDPVAEDVLNNALVVTPSPSINKLWWAGGKPAFIIKGLPEAGFGADTGSPCTKNLECASGVCPPNCNINNPKNAKPWRALKKASSQETVRTLLFGVGVCARTCA
jgi:hypothetical protein